ncbi:MAG: flagellar motor protein MotA, partial [Acetobacteraceae bacterium]
MTRPTGYLVRMVIFLAVVGVVVGLLAPRLSAAFNYNPILNGLIFLVALIGILWNVRQVLRLAPEVTWVETFQRARPRLATLPAPRMLASMASMLAARTNKNTDG